jgi:putative ubiquitin-RnfH superfamily antitoxin RatB of RatAB toxin-antitoxin module
MVKVELVYIDREQQTVHQRLELQQGATVADALHASGIHHSHPETKEMSVGVYAKQVTLETVLKDGDRVEIYRPLSLDPKENRRQRARGTK